MAKSIEELMKEEWGVRVSCGGKWLFWDLDEWVVMENVYGSSVGKCVFRGESIEKALAELRES